MSKSLWNSVLVNPGVLGVLLVGLAAAAQAGPIPNAIANETQEERSEAGDGTGVLEQIQNYSDESSTGKMGQITNASQFRDVQPSDWAYEALDRIVQKYGCLVGYPDGTYRGNRSLSRYEFAAGLNACLRQIEILIANQPQSVSRSDFEALQRLNEEFRTELATLGTKVNNLESRTDFLENRQFSTTTKLNGEVVLALVGVATGENANGGKIDNIPVLGTRTRLNFDSSFTGKDLLRTRLQATNLNALSANSTFTPEGDLRLTAGAFSPGSNDIVLDALLYSFPIGEKTTVVLEANAGAIDDFTNTINPYLDGDGGSGAFSQFATRNPIYYLLNNAGIGLKHEFSDNLELSLGYLGNSPADPSPGNGIFRGPYGAIAQLTIKPSDKINLGLTYVNAYNNDFTANGSTGSNRANLRSALLNNPNLPTNLQQFAGADLPTSTNAYGFEASWKINPKFVLGGWVGYTATRTLSPLVATDGTVVERGDLNTFNWALTLNFPDLGKKGNFAGIIVGMEPKVTRVSDSLRAIGTDKDTSLHLEALYQHQLTDNIAVTPGIIWLTAPDHNNNNADVIIGTVRTTFTF